MDSAETGFELALHYHNALPDRLRDYLRARGISDEIINNQLVGWNGWRITIPVMGREGRINQFRLAKDPEDHSNGPKMLSTPGAKVELYGWETLMAQPTAVIICEGEFDRLVLESSGFNAVTSTGGAATFRPEWVDAFPPSMDVYICFDRDEAGELGARRVAQMIPHARITRLPEDVGPGGDITDFFVKLGRTREDFIELLRAAEPLPEFEYLQLEPENPDPNRTNGRGEIERLKALVPIDTLISRYIFLQRSGKHFVGLCPFHEDRRPSFVVYPSSHTFYCFGCQAHGDAFDFLMRHEKLSFPEALQVLRRLAT